MRFNGVMGVYVCFSLNLLQQTILQQIILREVEIEFEMVFFYGGNGRVEYLHGVDEARGEVHGVDSGEDGATASEGDEVGLARVCDKNGVIHSRQRESECSGVCRFSKWQRERGDAFLPIRNERIPLHTAYTQAPDRGETHGVVSAAVSIQPQRVALQLNAHYHVDLLSAFGVGSAGGKSDKYAKTNNRDGCCSMEELLHFSS